MRHCDSTLSSEGSTVGEKSIVSKIVLECDTRNINIVKMAMPKHVVHHKAEDLTDEELQRELQLLVDQGKLVPTLGKLETIDAQS